MKYLIAFGLGIGSVFAWPFMTLRVSVISFIYVLTTVYAVYMGSAFIVTPKQIWKNTINMSVMRNAAVLIILMYTIATLLWIYWGKHG